MVRRMLTGNAAAAWGARLAAVDYVPAFPIARPVIARPVIARTGVRVAPPVLLPWTVRWLEPGSGGESRRRPGVPGTGPNA